MKDRITMVKIEVTETELRILHWTVKRQLDRLLQAKETGHNIDERYDTPNFKEIKGKNFCEDS